MRRPSIHFTTTKWDEMNLKARAILELFSLSGVRFKFTGPIRMDDGRELQLKAIEAEFHGTKLTVQTQRGLPVSGQMMFFRAELMQSHQDDPQIAWI